MAASFSGQLRGKLPFNCYSRPGHHQHQTFLFAQMNCLKGLLAQHAVYRERSTSKAVQSPSV
jgi:hypothetical protein